MNADEPREQTPGSPANAAHETGTPADPEATGQTEVLNTQGWSQFGDRPPATGQFRSGNTAVFTVPPPPPPPPAPAAKASGSGLKKGGAVLALAAMALGGGVAGALVTNAISGPQTVISSPVVNSGSSTGTTIADVARRVQPSVVMITVTSQTGGGEGSGVILSDDGLILTNNHVVTGAGDNAQLSVKFSDGRTAKATLVGTDPTTDIAVIRAQDVSGLTKASLGDSDRLQVGDSVLAIGSPLGLEGSVTAGIISALDRTVTSGGGQPEQQMPPGWGQLQGSQAEPTTIGGMIQTDAAINPGNSGGALVNAAGQVIGVNTAIATSGGNGNIGVGFAIPITTAKQVAEQLINTGKAVHVYLGVSVSDATGDTPGALVGPVTAGSPAAKAGLQQGDIITKIDDTSIDAGETVVGIIRGHQPGDKITLTYIRNGQPTTVTVSLEEKTATN
ncbi:serine protease [Acrocarpospora pleiomorpha]|uniref:Serine protease n=1 Tax=Acrocarpospora pleiomorpha TaxID=90975 RepID=A0A5M3XIY7_9ACTN|nr:trypsin-like peptidase domain-containing protein [Acrocarpospora pleiomorpha]GES21435.1 serine protease [Acrocarpospora pleiomorpha]